MSRFDLSLLARARQYIEHGPTKAPAPSIVAAQPVTPAALPDDQAVQLAAILIKRFEGLYLRPYLCPAAVPTIGYGATSYPDGRRVTMRDAAITEAKAEALLLWQIRAVYLPAVRRLCPGVQDAKRLAALTDFTFNLGVSRLAASTLRRRVIAEEWALVQIGRAHV